MEPLVANGAIRRLLVVLPNWVGDVVLATPILAALRAHFKEAHIAYLMRRYVAEIVAGGSWHDAAFFWPDARSEKEEATLPRLCRRLKSERFDTVLLLTNSLRSALAAWLARIPRRVGYAREARGWLLTDRLKPLKHNGEFTPTPMLGYYAKIAQHVGCPVSDVKLKLGITAEQEQAGAELKRHYGLNDGGTYAIINPGAAFGAAKCWPPERFAEVCDRLNEELRFQPVIVGAPNEIPLMQEIVRQAKTKVIGCENPGTTLGSLKPLVRDAALVVCNDTGPRHYGNAFDVPTVTIFGPTFQAWTDTDYAGEIKLQVPVECGPCMLRTCPLDHRCMTGVTTDMVMAAARGLLERASRKL